MQLQQYSDYKGGGDGGCWQIGSCPIDIECKRAHYRSKIRNEKRERKRKFENNNIRK